jgi:hypothetical protein
MRPSLKTGNTGRVETLTISSVKPARGKIPWRLPLWFAFLGLTALIVVYPVNLRLESFPLLSPDIFPNLPLFGTLFYLWAASLLVLLFTPSGERAARWERLALVTLAALVFRGFWNIISPLQGQALAHATATKIWLIHDRVIPYPQVAFIGWPGLSLTSALLSRITEVELFSSIAVLTVFMAILMGIATYVFLLNVLKLSLYAAVGSILILEGSLTLIMLFSPGPLGLTLMVVLLAVLFAKRAAASPSSYFLVSLLLLTAEAVTRLEYSMLLLFILLGLWGFAALRRNQAEPGPATPIVLLSLIISVAWVAYWGTEAFSHITRQSMEGLINPMRSVERLITVLTVAQTNFGESAPLWYSRTRLFWFAWLYVAGGVIWLWSLKKLLKLESTEGKLAAALLGLVLINLISVVVSSRGFGELLRLVQSGVFFTCTFLLLFVRGLRRPMAKTGLGGLAFAMLVLSFPSFLASNLSINSFSTHRSLLTGGQWLESLYGTGQGINVFGTLADIPSVQFYLYDAKIIDGPHFLADQPWTEEGLWRGIDGLITQAERAVEGGNSILYVHSFTFASQMSATLGVPTDHPRWGQITKRLSEGSHLVYDNGPIQVFNGLRALVNLTRSYRGLR